MRPIEESDPLIAQIQLLEETLLNPAIKDDPELVDQLVADDFVEIDDSGKQSTKSHAVLWLENPQPHIQWLVTKFRIRELADGLVMANYIAIKSDTLKGSSKSSARSSIWRRVEGSWELIFHQGTNLPNPE